MQWISSIKRAFKRCSSPSTESPGDRLGRLGSTTRLLYLFTPFPVCKTHSVWKRCFPWHKPLFSACSCPGDVEKSFVGECILVIPHQVSVLVYVQSNGPLPAVLQPATHLSWNKESAGEERVNVRAKQFTAVPGCLYSSVQCFSLPVNTAHSAHERNPVSTNTDLQILLCKQFSW